MNTITPILKTAIALVLYAVVFNACSDASRTNQSMKIGVIPAVSESAQSRFVIYNDDETRCLSTIGKQRKGKRWLTYRPCKIDGTDTWQVRANGKVQNPSSGKCLSSARGKENFVLTTCNVNFSHDYLAYDFLIMPDIDQHTGFSVAQNY